LVYAGLSLFKKEGTKEIFSVIPVQTGIQRVGAKSLLISPSATLRTGTFSKWERRGRENEFQPFR